MLSRSPPTPKDHVIAHHQRRHGCPISLFDIADFYIPTDFAILCFERNQVCIGSGEVEPLFVHRDATMPKVHTCVWLVRVVPDLVARTGVDSPHVVRHGEIQHAIDQQRRGLDGCILAGLKRPRQPDRCDVLGSDLGQRAVSSAGIVAVVARPGVGRRVCNGGGIKPLRQKPAWEKEQQANGSTISFSLKEISYFLSQRLQVGHQVMDVVVSVFFELLDMSVRG